ncbi:RHS repeat-associated core domain-containing protein [Actinoplanes sp. NPDC048791]|uniref:RHS repeat-associated core domain-containing protein n=1 Tax=Actinoplanes sp. NPDC048791 TaxID=3154623 RepID=UPI0033D6F169
MRRASLAAGLAGLLLTTFAAVPARADDVVDEAAREARRPKTQQSVSIDVGEEGMQPPLAVGEDNSPARVAWPTPAAATVAVPAAADQGTATPGGLPVTVEAPDKTTTPAPSAVRVEVLDRAAADRAGIDGLLLSVSRSDGKAAKGEVNLGLDYSAFARAYGGDWASRLRLASVPACALTTPDQPQCRTRTPLDTHNDRENERVVADVPAPPVATGGTRSRVASASAAAAGVGLLAVSSGASGGTGSYAATSLAPSGSWQNSGNTGGFSWQYPLRVPPALAGPSPQLSFGYSSASVDGRVGSTNNQPSVVGEGFDLAVGFIERSYRSCTDDGHDERGEEKYDLCWHSDNATMSFAGRNGELVKKSADEWRLKSDDGTKITRETGGFHDGHDKQYWVVTTTDGTRYYFGKGKRTADDTESTESAWQVPVYGDDAGEPCHDDKFADSRCLQTWRWNLDYVVDAHGNTMTYYWNTETNRYGANRDDKSVQYDRGGYLKRIEYGERYGDERETKAPARVQFSVAERCKGDDADCEPGDLKEGTATRWPDVPFDQICTDDESCEEQWSPTFFTRKRLKSVTTQVLGGGDYRDVDTWELAQSYPDPADASTASLWLDSITHTGKASGADITLPKTTFTKTPLDNRVDRDGDDRLAFKKFRITGIQSESGGLISVNYAKPECTWKDLPTPETNTRRCYPSYWSTEGQIGEDTDWFHKYVVESIVENGRTANSVAKVTSYQYLGGAAWHYDDSEITKADKKTWGQFRGYRTVRTIVGGTGTADRLRTEATFLRGMDGDRKGEDGGRKEETVTASDGTEVTDHDRYQGFLLEQRTFNGESGAEISGLVNTPWLSEPTASEGADDARLLAIKRATSRTALDGGKVRRTSVEHEYDGYGMLRSSDDRGDLDVSGDESCTENWYNRNVDKRLLTLVSRVRTVSVGCDATPSLPADAVSDVRTSYNGKDFDETPANGDVTRTEQAESYTDGKPNYLTVARSGYDKYGRLRYSYDAGNNQTETRYVPAEGGPVTGMSVINPLGQDTTSTVDPAFGLVTQTEDANDQRTALRYDALGRLVKVWLAGRSVEDDVPDIEYVYSIQTDKPVSVTTKTLTPNGGVRTSYALYDGMLRPRQNQEPSPNVGRIITDTQYDSRGLTVEQAGPFYNKEAAGTTLADTSSAEGKLPLTQTVYDAAGRAKEEIFKVGQTEKWRTSTSYHGDHTDVTPPKGQTPTTSYTNAQGLTTRLVEYRGAKAEGPADTTSYRYDKADRLEEIEDAAGNLWKYGYDLLGRQTSSTDPDAGSSTIKYNKLDQVESTTDARKRTLAYKYDKLGRPELLEEVPAAPATTRTKLAAWTYDTAILGKGRAATATRYVGTNAYTSTIAEYDVAGRPKNTSVTIPGSENNLAGTYTAKATYNIDGSPETITSPAAGDLTAETLRYGYNARGMPTFLTGTSGYVRDTTYSDFGEALQYTLGTSTASKYTWLTQAYEEGTRRLQNSRVDREAVTGTDTNATYAYDAAGNITSIADQPSQTGTKADVQCFQYDYLRRLTEAWAQATTACAATPVESVLGGAAPYWQSFKYDVAGNRTEEVTHRTVATGTDVKKVFKPYGKGAQPAHAVDRTDVTSTTAGKAVATADTYKYDANGNTVERNLAGKPGEVYRWDAEGRVSEVLKAGVVVASFVYDANGNRLIRRDIAGKAVTLYLGGMELKLDTSTADVKTQKVTATRYYSYAGMAVAVRTKAAVTWLAGGQNGTAELSINAADSKVVQRRTLPFGGVRGSTGTWPGERGFVGGTNDALTGLIHLGAREYDPATGRFLSVDPVIDFSDPQQLNAYAYGRNNPFAFPDPSGMWWGWSNTGHLALDVIGLVPAFGEAADLVNGVWYAAEGNYVDSALSFASAIPIAGYGASAAKGAKYADEAIDAVDAAVDTAKTADNATDAAKAADNVVPPAAPKAATPPKPDPPAKPKDAPSGAKDTSPAKADGGGGNGGGPGGGGGKGGGGNGGGGNGGGGSGGAGKGGGKPDLDAMSKSGQTKEKGGKTSAGRAYQKHSDRGEVPKVPGKEHNSVGQNLLDDILTDPHSDFQPITSKTNFGGTRVISNKIMSFVDDNGAVQERFIGVVFSSSGRVEYFGMFL